MTTNTKGIHEMTDEEFEQWLKDRLKEDAYRGNMKTDSYRMEFKQEIYLIDEDGEIIDSGEYSDRETAEGGMSNFVYDIFSNGKEDEWTIRYVTTEVRQGVFYDPKLTVRWKENTRNSRIIKIKEEEIKKMRYQKWEEATNWLISKGCKLRPKFNFRKQVIKEVAKNGLGKEFNEKYPEFKISEGELNEWENYYNNQKKKK